MKKTYLFFVLVILFQSIFSQKTWQEATKIADSLSSELKYDSILIYRNKAINLAKNESVKIKKTVLLFKEFSELELDLSKSKLKKVEYDKLKVLMKSIDSLDLNNKFLYSKYKSLYIYAFNIFYNFKDSEKYSDLALGCFKTKKVKDTAEWFNTYYYNAINKRELGKLSAASNSFGNALDLWLNYSKNDLNFLASLYIDYSNLYHKRFLNIPPKQIELLKKAEQIFSTMENPDVLRFSFVYTNLGDLELDRTNYQKALGYYKKNYQIFKKKKHVESINRTFTNNNLNRTNIKKEVEYYKFLTDIYANTNQETELLEALNKMISLKKKHRKGLSELEYSLLSVAHLNVGRFYLDKDIHKAKKYYGNGELLNPEKTIHKHSSDYQLAFGKIAQIEKDYKSSIIFFNKVITNPKAKYSNKVNAYKLSAITYIKQNDYTNAFNYINKTINSIAVKKTDSINIKNLKVSNYTASGSVIDAQHFVDLAKVLQTESNSYTKEIFNLYKLALIHFESNFKNNFVNPNLNKLYKEINQGIYGAIFNPNKNIELENTYLSSFENIESKLLLNSFLQNRTISSNEKLNPLYFKEQEIRGTITFLKKKLTKEQNENTNQLLFEENEKLDDLLVAISKNNKSKLPVFDLNNFKKINKKNILKYKKIGNDLYVLSFVGTKFNITKVANFKTIKEKVELFNTLLINPNSSIKHLNEIGKNLFELLIPKEFSTKAAITIIPDDILYYLPFELLQFQDDYLLKNSVINYASSLSFLNANIKNSLHSNKITLFSPKYKFKNIKTELAVRGEAYNLKGAEEEVKAISEILKNSNVFIGDNASKKAFLNLKNDYAVLHLAMHSVLNDDDPELSTLLFSNNEELHISELYGLKLNADLAVLSACNTGVGKLKDGKGIVSMNNAFTYAGIPSTISSLWSAPDQSTKEIMVDFYKNLKKKETFSQSLRNAKLNYLNNVDAVELAHPYYWAGFVLYGNDQSIDLSNGNNYYLKWIGLLLILGIILLIFKKYKN